uniref:Uncharacterized protein n=1 Tax=Avena sativa TaxID=4498 RepID=A0ACD5XYA7_AVESA
MIDTGGNKKTDDHPVAETAWPARGGGGAARRRDKKEKMGRAGVVLMACVLTLLLLVLLFGGRGGAPAVWQNAAKLTAMCEGSANAPPRPGATGADELFGGLLAAGSDRRTCRSRYESPQYYKHSPYTASPHLLQKLRQYEARHKKCGPGTPEYAKSIASLRSGSSNTEAAECRYLVWLPYNGLGNRMLSLLSTFLYALLTDRVLLVRSTADFTDLFCEPFPDATWNLPPDFPVANMSRLGVQSDESYGNLLRRKKISNQPETAASQAVPPYVYAHLAHGLRITDQLFYCNDDQIVLAKVTWLLLQNDLYYVPLLYGIAEFEDELRRMIPARESVSHFLARYLFHPSNSVWGMVTRYHHSYLAHAEERIGVQVRMFPFATIPADDMYKQIMACSRQEGILPEIDDELMEPGNATGAVFVDDDKEGTTSSNKAVLVVSLHADYYERIKRTYYEHAAKGGGSVGVFQPSHEERQQRGQRSHNQKALAEIYLLSFSDVLLTTGMSTFGYMSSSLAGLRPTMLMVANDQKVPETPCVRDASMEPCCHLMNFNVKCRGKAVDKEELARHVKVCEDLPRGIKLVD